MKYLLEVTKYFFVLVLLVSVSDAQELKSLSINEKLTEIKLQSHYWSQAPVYKASLMAQPMIKPNPAVVTTPDLNVQSVYDGEKIAFRFSWKDEDTTTAGQLGAFSDAVAIQFPVRIGGAPPPIFMGAKGDPVHILHWRAQYQRDKVEGKPTMAELYPNMNIDMYPMDVPDWGTVQRASDTARESYSPGLAAGNPQAFAKSGVDEIIAEGFSTSAVMAGKSAIGFGKWKDGEWTVVIMRPLTIEKGSTIDPAQGSHVSFAVWQGGKGEVGARKSIMMSWVKLTLQPGQ